MDLKEKAERLCHLREEYRNGLEFHRVEFSEIEKKVKYYITVLIPVFLAIGGYKFREISQIGGHLSAYMACLLTVLFFAILMLVLSLKARGIDAGILRPDPPEVASMGYYLDGDGERWLTLLEAETQEALRAFAKNERENTKKSAWLLRGELTLFFGVPFAPFIAVVLYSLLDASADQPGTLLLPFGVPDSIGVGICTGAVAWAVPIFVARHGLPRWSFRQ